ncbi:hypothetical protein JCM10207_001581 [Rhodosporidiobolus poonsookiae]
MSSFAETANPYPCRWRFCSETFPSTDALRTHVSSHVEDAEPHPKAERDAERELERRHDAGAAVAGGEPERPEMSFPEINKKTGEVEPGVHQVA